MLLPKKSEVLGRILLIGILGMGGFFAQTLSAYARPEYALRQKMNCTACHVLPTGGGPRNLYGKVYGSRGYSPGPLSTHDTLYAELRAHYMMEPDDTDSGSNGFSVMSASVSANAIVSESAGGDSSVKIVGTYDLGLADGPREAVVLWSTGAGSELLPDQIMVGRFYKSFGLATEEHRTYTRMITGSSLRDFEGGIQFNWLWGGDHHFDLAYVNGFNRPSQLTGKLPSSFVTHYRWNPSDLFFLLGSSASISTADENRETEYALALYKAIDFRRLLGKSVALTWSSELTLARTPNGIPSFFASTNSSFAQRAKKLQSMGIYSWMRYDADEVFTIIAKFDYLNFNPKSSRDAFVRAGLGFDWQFDSNFSVSLRGEKSWVSAREDRGSGISADKNLVYAQLRAWL